MTETSNTTAIPDLRLLELLSQTFPSVGTASTEIINLEAILSLPKGTEHSPTYMANMKRSAIY